MYLFVLNVLIFVKRYIRLLSQQSLFLLYAALDLQKRIVQMAVICLGKLSLKLIRKAFIHLNVHFK